MHRFVLLLCFTMLSTLVPAQSQEEGYRITIDIDNYNQDTLFLGHYLGKSQYLSDTATVDREGRFVFEGETALRPGVYLVVMKPDNKFFQLVIPENDQRFRLVLDADNPTESMRVEGSEDNHLFYDYMNYLAEQRPQADSLRTLRREMEGDNSESIDQALAEMDRRVREYQEELVMGHPETVTAVIVKAGWEPEVPDFEGDADEVKRKRYFYYKEHYFDYMDLSDSRLVRSPVLFGKLDYYIKKLVPQHPDSIARGLDSVLVAMLPNQEAFQYYLVHWLNHFARSKLVGMDAVYVNLVENYYMTGLADWTEEETLKKIVDNAMTLKPLLIGKKAPNVTLETREGEKVRLHELDAPFTVLYFWRPDCPHCKESTPKLIDFYKEYNSRGVEVLAVCMKFTRDVPKCWEYIDKQEGMDLWYNLVDPYHRSKFSTLYDVKTTPMVYLLDKDKKILSKRIGVEQLPALLDHFLSQEETTELQGTGN